MPSPFLRRSLWFVAGLCLLVTACARTPKMNSVGPKSASAIEEPAAPLASWVFGLHCNDHPEFSAAAAFNAAAEKGLAYAPFGRPETGWAIYAPLAEDSLHTRCAPETQGFAAAVSRWQGAHGLTPDGALTADTFQTFKGVWQEERPFVMLRIQKICPTGADETQLEALMPDEILGDKPVSLRPRALAALRQMVEAARRDLPQADADPQLLTAFSGYRSPTADAARCEVQRNCQGMVRAQCSAHRTGLAIDLNVGWAPGFTADSTDDRNRLYQSRTPAYQWLVRNAAHFGFVNYPFEPWHWEWTGEAP